MPEHTTPFLNETKLFPALSAGQGTLLLYSVRAVRRAATVSALRPTVPVR